MYDGNVIEQVDEFKYLGILTHGTKGLSPALELLCKAAKHAMFGLQRRCQQFNIQDPVLKCKPFDILVRPILCYCCEVWSVLGSKSDLKDLERAMFGLQRRCQQFNIQDPVLKCKPFDILVRPILCYCCEVWSVLGSKSDLKDLERVELGFLKALNPNWGSNKHKVLTQ